MSDPRDYPDTLPHRQREEAESMGWLPIAIAGGIIAVIAVLAFTLPQDQQNTIRADRPGISTDLDTTGRAIPKQ